MKHIDQFSGMNSNGGIYYLDGFSVENENGATSLDENYSITEKVNTATTNFTNLGSVMAMLYAYPLTGSNIAATDGYTLMMNETGKFFTHYNLANVIYGGEIADASTDACLKPDLFMLPSGNIIFSQAKYLGLMVRGLAKTGSSTAKIIDKAGRNFTTLGLSATAPNNKVTNLLTGIQYTITSISTTTTTDDTLNFTASGTNDNAENDEFVALVNNKWDLENGMAVPTFSGQPTDTYWAKPIRQFGIGDLSKFLILNGNYIALLSNDEATIDVMYKALPTGYQGISMEVNNGYVLVSATDNNGGCHLIYWDGFSDGWNKDTPISRAPSTLKAHGTGFVYIADSSIYSTDGRNIQKLIEHPDNKNLGQKLNTNSHNGIAILDDIMYFAVSGTMDNRSNTGVFVFNTKTGLSFFKTKQNSRAFNIPNCIYVKSNNSSNGSYTTNNDIEIGCASSYCNLNDFTANVSPRDYRSFVYFVDLKEDTQIKQIRLNLKAISKKASAHNGVSDITVSVGDGNDGIIQFARVTAVGSTTLTNGNGEFYPILQGDQLEMISSYGAGQLTWATAVTGGGTASESVTISPELEGITGTAQGDIRLWKVKKGENRLIDLSTISKPQLFNVNFIGSKLYIKVDIRGNANSAPVSIQDITLS